MLPETVASYEHLCKSSAMNISLLTNRDLASHIVLSRLIGLLSGHRLSIFISEKVGRDQSLPQPLMALAEFEKQLIAASPHSFDSLARQAGCRLQGFADIDNRVNGTQGIERIKATEPDVILSIRFGLIIREPIIAIPKYGVINLHSGLLPDYRGVMASFRAMVNGDAEIGSTLHYIQDGGVDTGDILSIARAPLNPEQSYLLNVLSLYTAGCRQMAFAVQQLDSDISLRAQPQQGQANYYSFPTDLELEEFFALGYQLFNPAEIEQIRALQA
jgi:methionyl-tRNA formyltransferase